MYSISIENSFIMSLTADTMLSVQPQIRANTIVLRQNLFITLTSTTTICIEILTNDIDMSIDEPHSCVWAMGIHFFQIISFVLSYIIKLKNDGKCMEFILHFMG